MLCGPFAAQHATGVDYRTIVRYIRWHREQKGRRQSLRGGTSISEIREALFDQGWHVHRVFHFRRIRLRDLAKRITEGRWIFHQRGHFFGVRSGNDLRQMARRAPDAIVLSGYLLHKHGRDA